MDLVHQYLFQLETDSIFNYNGMYLIMQCALWMGALYSNLIISPPIHNKPVFLCIVFTYIIARICMPFEPLWWDATVLTVGHTNRATQLGKTN